MLEYLLIILILCPCIFFYFLRRWAGGRYCTEFRDLTGKTIIISGGNSGIGFETAKILAKMGKPHIILACRDLETAQLSKQKIKQYSGNENVLVLKLDLADLSSIRFFVESFFKLNLPLNILINNAGVFMTPYGLTKDGFEIQFGTNHLGTFYLTYLLLPKMRESKGGRIIVVSSTIHQKGYIDFDDLQSTKSDYNSFQVYANTKLANILFTKQLQRRLQMEASDITVNAVHPGVVSTNLGRYSWRVKYFMPLFTFFFGKSPHQAAQTSVFATISSQLEGKGGLYLSDCCPAIESSNANDINVTIQLWNVSATLLGLYHLVE